MIAHSPTPLRWLVLLVAGLLALVANLLTGATPVTELLGGLTGHDPLSWQIFMELRLPRALLALAVGGLLGWAGMAMQSLFRNPLADPGLVGVSAGAAAAAVLGIALLGLGLYARGMAAFVGALGVLGIIYALATRHGRTDLGWMLLAGIAFNAIASALIGLSLYVASDEALRQLTWWLLGSFAEARLPMALGALGLLALLLGLSPAVSRGLDALLLGEASAWQMGVPVQRLKTLLLLLTALAVGVSVATSGMIGFVGLAAPHLARLLTGSLHRALAPASVLIGALLALSADSLARLLAQPAEVPVGLLLSALGGPFFLWLLLRMRRV